jgi:hypothetical protein
LSFLYIQNENIAVAILDIQKWSVKIFKSDMIDDLDSGVDSNKDYKSLYHGPEPLVRNLDSYEAEITFLKSYIDDLFKEDSSQSICVMLRTKNWYRNIKIVWISLEFRHMFQIKTVKMMLLNLEYD